MQYLVDKIQIYTFIQNDISTKKLFLHIIVIFNLNKRKFIFCEIVKNHFWMHGYGMHHMGKSRKPLNVL